MPHLQAVISSLDAAGHTAEEIAELLTLYHGQPGISERVAALDAELRSVMVDE